MRQFILLILASLSLQATTIYYVNRDVGIGFVQGTITTDDTIGVLSTANILAWDLTINSGVSSAQLSNTLVSNTVAVVGTQFSATATELLFNFDGQGVNYFYFEANNSANFWCVEARGCAQQSPFEAVRVGIDRIDLPRSGLDVIGSTVPEPGTWALVALSGSFLALLRRPR